MAKKPAPKKKAGKRRFGAGGVTAAEVLQSALGSGDAGSYPARTSVGEPGGGPLARSGSRAVGRPGGPTIDVDMPKRIPGSKLAGSGQSDAAAGRNLLSGPKASAPEVPAPRPGMLGRAGAGALALGAGVGAGLATQKGIQSLATGPSAGMDSTGTIAALNRSDKGNQRVVMKGDLPVGVAPKRASAGFTDAADVGPPRPLGPTGKTPTKAPAKKAVAKASDDDAFMADLRASAARMKADTAEAARATGRMKEATGRFAGSFDEPGMKKGGACKGYAKGGAIRGRGDGIAQRGHTKGKFR